VRLLFLPWEMIKEQYFYAPAFADDKRIAATVIRVTASTIERHAVVFGQRSGDAPDLLTPFGESFYALCPGMILCKWTGTQFVTATQREERDFGGIDHLIRGDIGNNPVNGWRRRDTDPTAGDQFSIEVGGKFSILVRNNAKSKLSYPDISIELLRPSEAPVDLWHVNGAPRRVSEKEYRAAFNAPLQ